MLSLLALLALTRAEAATYVWSVFYGCDNDNPAGTWCSGNEKSDSFEYVESSTGGFKHNDARISSEAYSARYTWKFTAKATIYTGEIEFWAWVPTVGATGVAMYYLGCEQPDGTFTWIMASIDQRQHQGEWVYLNTLGAQPGSLCTVELYGAELDEGETVAADYMKMRVRYDAHDPVNQ